MNNAYAKQLSQVTKGNKTKQTNKKRFQKCWSNVVWLKFFSFPQKRLNYLPWGFLKYYNKIDPGMNSTLMNSMAVMYSQPIWPPFVDICHTLDWKFHKVRNHASPIYNGCQPPTSACTSQVFTSWMKAQISQFSQPLQTRAKSTKGSGRVYLCLFLSSLGDNYFIYINPKEFSMESTVLVHAL